MFFRILTAPFLLCSQAGLPRNQKEFCKAHAIYLLLGVTEMWESLKQGLTGPETALDGCFSHSASVYPVPWSHVAVRGA